ncbi:MAG TPA: hypothetical protein EYH30_02620 [Anaerolineales bacterium]|nr:hypothetical protein [Anaerolineae bacterium]HIQ01017.1 hypothetical protein [Anaerolineales bacterium]
MKARSTYLGALLSVLTVLLAARIPLPQEAKAAVMHPFDPDEQPRIHSAHRMDLLLEDLEAGAMGGAGLPPGAGGCGRGPSPAGALASLPLDERNCIGRTVILLPETGKTSIGKPALHIYLGRMADEPHPLHRVRFADVQT